MHVQWASGPGRCDPRVSASYARQFSWNVLKSDRICRFFEPFVDITAEHYPSARRGFEVVFHFTVE